MAKRRTVILGLGVLATGTAASLTGASLSNTASAEGDFRVVVEDGLVVEPGDAFRDGNDNFDPGNGYAWAYDLDNLGNDTLFSGDQLNTITVDDGPKAAAINNEDNGDLVIEIATWLDENAGRNDDFGNLLQVRNTGTTQRNVGIGFDKFGDDVGPEIGGNDVREIYEFENSGGIKISEDAPNDIANWFKVKAGETRQVTLSVDTTGYYNEILDLADGTNPFSGGGDHTTVDLVDSIEFGTQEGDPQDPGNL